MGIFSSIASVLRSVGGRKDAAAGVCSECGVEFAAASPLGVCAGCGHHFPMSVRVRLGYLLDTGSFVPTPFHSDEAITAGFAQIDGYALGVLHWDGKVGVVGCEDATNFVGQCIEKRLPLLLLLSSQGLREEDTALEMRKVAAVSGVLGKHAVAGLGSIALLINPTKGVGLAALASGCDMVIAEPHCIISFGETPQEDGFNRKWLPRGVQTAEFLQAKGFLDAVVSRPQQRDYIIELLGYMKNEK